jgi:hypothetical protein
VTEIPRVGTLVATARGTWGLNDSPYILRPGDVPPRLLVTGTNVVEPGVEIFVDLPETIIDVTGAFRVNGTADQPVVITANDRQLFCDDNRGWWEGFLVNGPSGNVNFTHAQVRYAVNGVRLRDSGSAILNSTFIKCCGTNGILNEGVGSVSIDSCEVTDVAGHGINVTNAASRPSAISITNSDISFNGNTGLVLNFIDPANETPVTIEGNRFQYNDTHGISMEAWVWPQIHYNHFNSNGDLGASNIWLQNPFHDSAGNTIDVTCNFWGQAVSSQAVIDNTIRDSLDNSNLGARLDTQPWLNADPYLAATPPPCDGQEAQVYE